MAETIKWPKGKRCAVSLSFDLDGESPWIHRDAALAERPLTMSMGAYGPKTGAPRILDVLDRYSLKDRQGKTEESAAVQPVIIESEIPAV